MLFHPKAGVRDQARQRASSYQNRVIATASEEKNDKNFEKLKLKSASRIVQEKMSATTLSSLNETSS